MMGSRQEAQDALFYEFSIEAHVPPDHMLRSVDQFVDLGGIRQQLAPFYSSTGRPSVDPELMIRMLLVGYIMGIRSERRLCEEVHLNLAYRWFCRLDLTDPVPDHSTFSKNRHGRFRDSNLLRHLFETVVARCLAEGLASGQRLAADASIIQADANRQNSTPKSDWHPDRIDPADAPRAVRGTWTRSTKRPSAQRARSIRSSRRIPIRPRNGPELGEVRPTLPIPPTT
jgi:transposase